MDLSIVIINHNTKKLTEQTVHSILDCNPKMTYEIIVVDNSTCDTERYVEEHDKVIIMPHIENKGFSHGCNTGAAQANGEYILFLNSDTIMQQNALEQSLAYLREHPEIGCLGAQMILEDGSLDHACKRGFPTPWNALCYFGHIDRLFPKIPFFNGYRLNHLDRSQIHQVDAVTGAYMMMPKKLYEQLGGFSETYFMYGEDLDLCWCIKNAGYQVVYYAPATCIHLKGQSGRASKNPVVQYHFYNAMLIFYERYYDNKYPKWLTGIIKWAIRQKMPRLEVDVK